jgi:hypothetical protein
MISFSRFEARDALSPLHGEACSDEARSGRNGDGQGLFRSWLVV